MGYPVYKLIRAVNRQYPNNGFINYVDVREDMYDSDDPDKNKIIDEDLRDLINEAIQETYINIAVDEVYSFPTVPGQNQYVLPDDCDLRDIQEVTRTFWAAGCPIPPPPGPMPEVWFLVTFYAGEGGTGEMDPVPVKQGDTFTFPECTFTGPTDTPFKGWDMNGTSRDGGPIFQPGDEIEVQSDLTITALWGAYKYTIKNMSPGDVPMELFWVGNSGDVHWDTLEAGGAGHTFYLREGEKLGDYFQRVYVVKFDGQIEEMDLTTAATEDVTVGPTQHSSYPQKWLVITNYIGVGEALLYTVQLIEGGGTEERIAAYTATSDPLCFNVQEGETISDVYQTINWSKDDVSYNIASYPLPANQRIVVIPFTGYESQGTGYSDWVPVVGPTIDTDPVEPDVDPGLVWNP